MQAGWQEREGDNTKQGGLQNEMDGRAGPRAKSGRILGANGMAKAMAG